MWPAWCILPVACGLLIVPTILPAQSDTLHGRVSGRVIDPMGSPIREAEVLWQGDRRSVLTRADGSFVLEFPARGEVVILVRRPGYSAQALRFDLRRTASWQGDIMLAPGSFKLPEIEVIAVNAKPARYANTHKYDEFFQRRKLGLGTFVSREQIEKMNAFHTIEILRGIPGIYTNVGNPGDPTSADIRLARCTGQFSKVTVWVDGRMMIAGGFGASGPRSNSIDLAAQLERIAPSGIEMVEIYSGVSQIPGVYHWDGCGVIAIWTRHN
jgi:carboxypeptidase family protein/TonB-dependent receptor-like protein